MYTTIRDAIYGEKNTTEIVLQAIKVNSWTVMDVGI